MVPRYRDIHCIQLAGAARKSCGAPSTSSKPVSIGVISSPMRPMSWYSGSHDTARSAWVISAPAMIASMLAPTQRSGSITPFGAAVDPLVNWRIASRSGSSGGRAHASAPARAPARSRSSSSTIGMSPGGGSRNGASSASTTTTAASAFRILRRVSSTNSSIDPRRIGSGSATTAPPARKMAWTAVTSARVVGPRIPTCTPGPTPRACSAAAMPRASSWSRAHSICSLVPSPPAAEPTKVTVPPRSAAVWRRATTEGIRTTTRAAGPGLLLGRAPRVPVGDAFHRRAASRLEVAAGRVGDRDEGHLAEALGDPEQLGGRSLLGEVQGGPPRPQPAGAEGEHEAPDRRKDGPVEAGGAEVVRRLDAPLDARDHVHRDAVEDVQQVDGRLVDPPGLRFLGRLRLRLEVGLPHGAVELLQPGALVGIGDDEPVPLLRVAAGGRLHR